MCVYVVATIFVATVTKILIQNTYHSLLIHCFSQFVFHILVFSRLDFVWSCLRYSRCWQRLQCWQAHHISSYHNRHQSHISPNWCISFENYIHTHTYIYTTHIIIHTYMHARTNAHIQYSTQKVCVCITRIAKTKMLSSEQKKKTHTQVARSNLNEKWIKWQSCNLKNKKN